jgi:hypothetical protein
MVLAKASRSLSFLLSFSLSLLVRPIFKIDIPDRSRTRKIDHFDAFTFTFTTA